jgi:uncharacterized membrane protein (DUF485 family)
MINPQVLSIIQNQTRAFIISVRLVIFFLVTSSMFVWIARGLFGRARRSSVKDSVL